MGTAWSVQISDPGETRLVADGDGFGAVPSDKIEWKEVTDDRVLATCYLILDAEDLTTRCGG